MQIFELVFPGFGQAVSVGMLDTKPERKRARLEKQPFTAANLSICQSVAAKQFESF